MAGRVALMLAHGIQAREIVAITFTEAAASELLERIQGFVASLRANQAATPGTCFCPAEALCEASSQWTRCWSKPDSNSRSHPDGELG
jgi:ATP-dependent exoDNAse (exonuclease V) beta subunit